MSQIIVLLPIIIFPVAFVIGGVCLFRAIYFLVKALQNTVDGAFNKTYTSFNRLNVLWVADCLNENGKIYRYKAFKNIAIFIAWCLLFLITIQMVGA
jgi:hypothetical protein